MDRLKYLRGALGLGCSSAACKGHKNCMRAATSGQHRVPIKRDSSSSLQVRSIRTPPPTHPNTRKYTPGQPHLGNVVPQAVWLPLPAGLMAEHG